MTNDFRSAVVVDRSNSLYRAPSLRLSAANTIQNIYAHWLVKPFGIPIWNYRGIIYLVLKAKFAEVGYHCENLTPE